MTVYRCRPGSMCVQAEYTSALRVQQQSRALPIMREYPAQNHATVY